jgi:hypothetical protein
MQVFRNAPKILRWWLALSLLLAPVFSALEAQMRPAPPASPLVVADAAHAHHHATGTGNGGQAQPDAGCAQHDACGGQCCPGCAHCAGAMTPPAMSATHEPSILTPREPRLLSFALISPRERPPRNLTV